MTNHEKIQKIKETLSHISDDNVEIFESLLADKDTTIFNLKNELSWLKQQIKLGQQKRFGQSTEKSESLQIPLIFNEEAKLEVVAEQNTETIKYTRRKVKTKGRQLDTSKLLRERQFHDLSESEKICACGCQLEKIGEDISEQIYLLHFKTRTKANAIFESYQ